MSYTVRRLLTAAMKDFLCFLGAEAGTRLAKRWIRMPPPSKKPAVRRRKRRS